MSLSDDTIGVIFAIMCFIIGSLIYSQRDVFSDQTFHATHTYLEVTK